MVPLTRPGGGSASANPRTAPIATIYDPIHGPILVSAAELALIDSAIFRRLRFIKQLGLAEMAFPGATHSRLSHSIGAMHVASAMFDQVAPVLGLAEPARLRQALRLAVLFHDVGHPPLSHAAEGALPSVSELALGPWQPSAGAAPARHELMAVHLLRSQPLARDLHDAVGDLGITAEHIAALIAGRPPTPCDLSAFVHDGADLLPLLAAMVGGELDADRMDYLRRDATFTGVGTGHFDHAWLAGHLVPLRVGDSWHLGLGHRAIWALENFLLARQHMFLSVYHHHTAVALDTCLGFWLAASGLRWSSDPEAFAGEDDVALWARLRASSDPWARRLVARRPLRLVAESHLWEGHGTAGAADALAPLAGALAAAGMPSWLVRSESMLSRYGRGRGVTVPLMIRVRGGQVAPVDQYTPLYHRTTQVAGTTRLFCLPEDGSRALAARDRLFGPPTGT